MFRLINKILLNFRTCFKRTATWQWFVVLVLGFMVRPGARGVTSTISSLRLKPGLYHTMLHFFRSRAYETSGLYAEWIKIAKEQVNIARIGNYVLFLGDHLKMPKEGRRMPGIQTLHQESQNSGKPEYIEGHIIAHISAVATDGQHYRSLPLKSQRQEIPPRIEGTKKPDGDTIVTQMVDLAVTVAEEFTNEKSVMALDAYFAKASAFEAAAKAKTAAGGQLLEIVTRAPRDTAAFFPPPPPPPKKGRGRPRLYGEKISLYSFFNDMAQFTETTMILYGKRTKAKYFYLDLFWQPIKGTIRFVAVELNGNRNERCVLMSSSLELSAEEIISIYGLRFKIETSFDEQKNDMGCFSYHFWTTAIPKRKKWKKAEPPSDNSSKKRIAAAKRAMDAHICLGAIATGILTIVAFKHNREIWSRFPGWVKTIRFNVPSIAIVKETIAQELPVFTALFPHVPFSSILNDRRRSVDFLYDDMEFDCVA